jgi:hypothetical protein
VPRKARFVRIRAGRERVHAERERHDLGLYNR